MTAVSSNMMIELAKELQFGEVHFKHDPKTGFLGLIAIHNTNLGPALGGCRFKEYANLDAALYDVMRLARGMSYKSAMAGMPLGGGKSVIIKTPETTSDRTKLFEIFGSFVDSLNGRYVSSIDSGTTPEDMDIAVKKTRHVTSRQGGNPSPYTAQGVKHAMRAAIKHRLQRDSFEGLKIAIQGVGNVGFYLAERLAKKGAQLFISDVSETSIQKCLKHFSAEVVSPSDIHKIECDIYAPCALGAVLNNQTIPELNCKIVVGAANNQLETEAHGLLLHEKGILYGPDYVVNAGGVIHAGALYLDIPMEKVDIKVAEIYNTTLEIFDRAEKENISTHLIADRIAEERMGIAKA